MATHIAWTQMKHNSNLYSVVLSARHNPTAIGCKSDCIHPPCMALISVDTPLLSDIPNLKICVQRTRRKELPKWMEVHRYAIGSVASKRANNYAQNHITTKESWDISLTTHQKKSVQCIKQPRSNLHTLCLLQIP